jgi:hypothetical protein
MKTDELAKSVGDIFKLDPPAVDTRGVSVDDDWKLIEVLDGRAKLENTRTAAVALIGLDGIYSRFSDPARTTPNQKYAVLQLFGTGHS